MVMNYESCSCEQGCGSWKNGIMVLVSILAGIVFAVAGVLLFNFGYLTDVTPAVQTALISGLVYLFVLLGISSTRSPVSHASCCTRNLLAPLLVGIFGTIFASILAISSTLTAGAVYSLLIVALVFFFFAYMVISSLFLIKFN